MRFRLTRRSFLAVGGISVASVALGGYAFAHAGGDDPAAAAPQGQAVPAGPPAPTVAPGGTPMPPYEPEIVKAHEETRKARDIMRAAGKEFPLLVPTTAEGIEFSGVAPQFSSPQVTRVEMGFGTIVVDDPKADNRAITLVQIKSSLPVSFAPVKNLKEKRNISVRGVTATLEVGGPAEFHPQGSLYVSWEQSGIWYFIKTVGLSEAQLIEFAQSLILLF
jgi:hypothetical protein